MFKRTRMLEDAGAELLHIEETNEGITLTRRGSVKLTPSEVERLREFLGVEAPDKDHDGHG